MEQDWTRGIIGDLIIGTGAAVCLRGNGPVMGASGIVGRAGCVVLAAMLIGMGLAPASGRSLDSAATAA